MTPGTAGEGVELGHVDVDAQDIFGGEVEELPVGAGIDEGADVDIARGDDAVKGRIDAFEADELFEALDVGLRGLHLGGGGGGLGGEVVGVLLGDGVALEQILVARGLNLCVGGVGLGGGEIGLGLRQLLVDFRAGDGGQELALLHVCADVEVPLASGSRWCGRRSANRYRPGRCRAGRLPAKAGPAAAWSTRTSGAASALVCSCRVVRALRRGMIPITARMTATTTMTKSSTMALPPEMGGLPPLCDGEGECWVVGG